MKVVTEKSKDYKVLLKSAEDVPELLFGNPEFLNYSEEMFKTMFKYGGIGLAAPQIGDSVRMFVMNTNQTRRVCVNPVIERVSYDESNYKEGCLSFPDLHLLIKRPKSIFVSYLNVDGDSITEELDGIEARCFQHEFDHINGKVFLDHVVQTKLKLAREKARKTLKKKA